MIIKTFTVPPLENNNYLIIDEKSKEAALIDCSAVDEKIVAEIENQNATLKYVLLTHGHFDHIGGIKEEFSLFHTSNKPQVIIHANDNELLKQANIYLSMLGMPEMEIPQVDKFITDNEILKLGEAEIQVIHTPGHTQGCVCYLVENNLFSGDTIFYESVGRCDLEGGDFGQIVGSITEKIFTLPEEFKIYPGHGKPTTVGWEKLHNCIVE